MIQRITMAARVLALATLAIVASDSRCRAQADGDPGDYVAVKAYLDHDVYHPGDTARVAIEFKINTGMHVNGHVPTLDFMIPTDLKWDEAPKGAALSDITWPKPDMRAFEFSENKKICIYENVQRAYLTLAIAKDVAPGAALKVTGTFRAQGCTHTACYAPQNDDVKLTVRVVAADEEKQAVNEEKFPALKKSENDSASPGQETAALTGEVIPAAPAVPTAMAAAAQAPGDASEEQVHPQAVTAEAPVTAESTTTRLDQDGAHSDADCGHLAGKKPKDRSLGLMFLLSFLGGLGLTLTPCVLPLVPVTIGFFSRQSSTSKPLVMASLYVLGLALVYSALGTVAALSGGLFGSALQEPAVLIGIALLMVALALSMFGLWDLNLPTSFTSRIGGGRSGNLGALLMGAAMGIVAAPCVGPFVVSLLTYVATLGSTRPRLEAMALGASLFFVLALGLGFPFFLVGMGTASLRPGAWMVSVKKIFGFIILGTAWWFLRPLLGETWAPLVLAALLAATCITLFLPAVTAGAPLLHRRVLQGFGALAGVAAVVVTLLSMGLVGDGASAKGREFTAYSEVALNEAKSAGKPVVIDFTAEWCAVCKEIEHSVFPHPVVQSEFKNFTLLRADLTKDDDPKVKQLYERYRIKGLPCIVFLDRSGREVEYLRVSGHVKPEEFVENLKCAASISLAKLQL